MIRQVGVAQGQVRRGGCFSAVGVGIGRHPGIGRRRAHRRQFLGHWPQLRGGDKGLLEFAAARDAPGAARLVTAFDMANMACSPCRLTMGHRMRGVVMSRRRMLRLRRSGLRNSRRRSQGKQQGPGQ